MSSPKRPSRKGGTPRSRLKRTRLAPPETKAHTTPAKVLALQEAALVQRVEAVRATSKGELIGAELEIAVRQGIADALPSTMRVVPGFVVSPRGALSSHFDVLVLDARYPLLAVVNGSALVPLPAVLAAVEVKTSLDGEELERVASKAREIARFGKDLEVWLRQRLRERLKLLEREARARMGEVAYRRERDRTRSRNTAPGPPDFAAVCLASKVSSATIAKYLGDQGRVPHHVVVLRPTKPGVARKRRGGVPVNEFGPPDAVGRHYWVECTRDVPDSVCVRRTAFAFGFFALDLVIGGAIETLTKRGFAPEEVGEHFREYTSLLIDVEGRLGPRRPGRSAARRATRKLGV